MEFIDLKAQYRKMKGEIDRAVSGVIESAIFIQGSEVGNLERELSQFTGAKHCISCSSGTDALLISLMAIDLRPGDEVITSPFTFMATAEVIVLLGAVPVFVDIDPVTYNIDPSLIESKITPRTKAIIPVSLYGQCADMDEIMSIADKHNLVVIEDACQSFGASYRGRMSCNLSHIGCTSFFPSKPLGGYGDSGAIFTSDDELANRIRALMNHGQVGRYVHRYIGLNGRMDAIQAAVLRVKLKYFGEEITLREEIGMRYTRLLGHTDVVTPFVKADRTSVYAQYSIRVNERSKLVLALIEQKIPTAIHYPLPLYKQEALGFLTFQTDEYPVTEQVSEQILSLPMSAYLTIEDQDRVVSTLSEQVGVLHEKTIYS